MKENGEIIIWKGLESTCGTMGVSMKANTKMIKSMDLEYIIGQMGDVMKDTGTKVNNME